ncbi:MAG TPA: DUF983 domain-containing protein [Roseiflexaceae bacterium]|nr:DUF983 domain-containing protein [Roseiflexaceae bacterium]
MLQGIFRIGGVLLAGLVLRCPRCRRGRMFESLFRMRRECPICGLQFERAVGEVTGGMAINFVVTGLVITIGSLYFGLFSRAPLSTILLSFGAFAIIFPIVFYPISRGLWASFLYLTAANDERD